MPFWAPVLTTDAGGTCGPIHGVSRVKGCMRARALLFALLVVPVLHAQPLTMTFNFGGQPVGRNTFERSPDGSFSSVSKIDILTQHVESALTGRMKSGKLVEFSLAQKASGATATLTWKDGKYEAVVNGQKSSGKLEIKTSALFANYHPQLCGTIAAQLRGSTPGPQKIQVLLIDNLLLMPFGAALKSNRSVIHDGKRVPVSVLTLDLNNIKIEVPVTEDNTVVGWDVPVQKFQAILDGWTDVFVDPVAKYKELSQPTHTTSALKGLKIPMRDGVQLVADAVRPAEEGRYPVILSRTPYGRESQLIGADFWAKRGYVYIAQDVRGRGQSQGKWQPFMNERQDGYDTIDWISKQPWCDGNIGMIGGSYVGLVQWQAAVERHPALKCIIPQVSPPDAFFNIPYDHGVFMLFPSVWWSNIVKDKDADLTKALAAMKDPAAFKTLPLNKVDDKVIGQSIPWFDEWLRKDRPSQFKGFNFQSDLARVEIPALHISGWWDGDGIGTKMNWRIMADAGKTNQYLIYGPWTHAFNTSSRLGDVDYGDGAILELDSLYLRWFDTWLKGMAVGLDKVQPKVKVFVTGANEWRSFTAWPDPKAKATTFYFGLPSGGAVGTGSKGTLTQSPPSSTRVATYTYDPRAVQVPDALSKDLDMSGGSTQVKLKKGEQVLVYRSAPMKQALDIGGPISVDLHFKTNVKDTDFFASIVDVHPDGKMYLIGLPGKIRAKYISGWETPKLLTPGKAYKAKIELWDTAHRFKRGHRMGVLIQSEMFPMAARNLNTGEPYFGSTKMVTARQSILHGRATPSAIHFYVLPPK
jgi:putative CocE/NonD family hydrolase